jgi:hypothetical protein
MRTMLRKFLSRTLNRIYTDQGKGKALRASGGITNCFGKSRVRSLFPILDCSLPLPLSSFSRFLLLLLLLLEPCYVAQVDLEIVILLPQPPKFLRAGLQTCTTMPGSKLFYYF